MAKGEYYAQSAKKNWKGKKEKCVFIPDTLETRGEELGTVHPSVMLRLRCII